MKRIFSKEHTSGPHQVAALMRRLVTVNQSISLAKLLASPAEYSKDRVVISNHCVCSFNAATLCEHAVPSTQYGERGVSARRFYGIALVSALFIATHLGNFYAAMLVCQDSVTSRWLVEFLVEEAS